MVSPVLAQAILGLKGPDILGSFEEGRASARKEKAFQRGEESRELAGLALQEDGGESLFKLQGINPEMGLKIQQQLGARSAKETSEFIEAAGVTRRMLESGNAAGALDFANQRMAVLESQGRNTTQTKRIRDLLASGDTQQALVELAAFDDSINAAKQVSLRTSAPVEFTRADGTLALGIPTVDPRTGATTFEEVPLPPGAQLTSRRAQAVERFATTRAAEEGKLVAQRRLKPGLEGAVSFEKEVKKLQAQQRLQPAVAAAVVTAKAEATDIVKQAGTQRSNDVAFRAYDTAITGLANALEGTVTGPFAGFLPAITDNQQIAEGASAAMAPILKQVFRGAGEGTFTDKDQELLLQMAPTRKDSPKARVAKLANIDAIVRAKLGQSGAAPSGSTQAAPVAPAQPAAAPGSVQTIGRFKVRVK